MALRRLFARRSRPPAGRLAMQFILILAVLAAMAISETAPSVPVAGGAARLGLAVMGMAAVAAMGWFGAARAARQITADYARHEVLLGRFRRTRQWHVAVWLAVAVAILYWLGWARMVRFNWHLDSVPLVDDLLILLPVLLPIMACWAAYYEVERALQAGRATEPNGRGTGPCFRATSCSEGHVDQPKNGPVPDPPDVSRTAYLGLHVRHYLALPLLPLLGLLAIEDLMRLALPPEVRSQYETAAMLGAMAALFATFPLLLRVLWRARPLPAGALRDRLERSAGRARLQARDILVWHTEGMVVNAAVAGLLRRLRYVFLSDGLLGRLTDEEVEAVFAHEAGHVRHHHLPLRVMVVVAPLSLLLLLREIHPESVAQLQQWLGMTSATLKTEMALGMLAAMGLYMLVVFGFYSRLLEHQADWFACRNISTGDDRAAVEVFASALTKLTAATGRSRRSRGWQHASVARRIDFLERIAVDVRRQRRLRWLTRLLAALLVGASLGPLALAVLLG